MNAYADMEPLAIRQRILQRTGDAGLAEYVYRLANSERMYARQVRDLREYVDGLKKKLPSEPSEPRAVYLPRAPAESDG